jgi:hypothetical protein
VAGDKPIKLGKNPPSTSLLFPSLEDKTQPIMSVTREQRLRAHPPAWDGRRRRRRGRRKKKKRGGERRKRRGLQSNFLGTHQHSARAAARHLAGVQFLCRPVYHHKGLGIRAG